MISTKAVQNAVARAIPNEGGFGPGAHSTSFGGNAGVKFTITAPIWVTHIAFVHASSVSVSYYQNSLTFGGAAQFPVQVRLFRGSTLLYFQSFANGNDLILKNGYYYCPLNVPIVLSDTFATYQLLFAFTGSSNNVLTMTSLPTYMPSSKFSSYVPVIQSLSGYQTFTVAVITTNAEAQSQTTLFPERVVLKTGNVTSSHMLLYDATSQSVVPYQHYSNDCIWIFGFEGNWGATFIAVQVSIDGDNHIVLQVIRRGYRNNWAQFPPSVMNNTSIYENYSSTTDLNLNSVEIDYLPISTVDNTQLANIEVPGRSIPMIDFLFAESQPTAHTMSTYSNSLPHTTATDCFSVYSSSLGIRVASLDDVTFTSAQLSGSWGITAGVALTPVRLPSGQWLFYLFHDEKLKMVKIGTSIGPENILDFNVLEGRYMTQATYTSLHLNDVVGAFNDATNSQSAPVVTSSLQDGYGIYSLAGTYIPYLGTNSNPLSLTTGYTLSFYYEHSDFASIAPNQSFQMSSDETNYSVGDRVVGTVERLAASGIFKITSNVNFDIVSDTGVLKTLAAALPEGINTITIDLLAQSDYFLAYGSVSVVSTVELLDFTIPSSMSSRTVHARIFTGNNAVVSGSALLRKSNRTGLTLQGTGVTLQNGSSLGSSNDNPSQQITVSGPLTLKTGTSITASELVVNSTVAGSIQDEETRPTVSAPSITLSSNTAALSGSAISTNQITSSEGLVYNATIQPLVGQNDLTFDGPLVLNGVVATKDTGKTVIADLVVLGSTSQVNANQLELQTNAIVRLNSYSLVQGSSSVTLGANSSIEGHPTLLTPNNVITPLITGSGTLAGPVAMGLNDAKTRLYLGTTLRMYGSTTKFTGGS